jgi:hypothetical protein
LQHGKDLDRILGLETAKGRDMSGSPGHEDDITGDEVLSDQELARRMSERNAQRRGTVEQVLSDQELVLRASDETLNDLAQTLAPYEEYDESALGSARTMLRLAWTILGGLREARQRREAKQGGEPAGAPWDSALVRVGAVVEVLHQAGVRAWVNGDSTHDHASLQVDAHLGCRFICEGTGQERWWRVASHGGCTGNSLAHFKPSRTLATQVAEDIQAHLRVAEGRREGDQAPPPIPS